MIVILKRNKNTGAIEAFNVLGKKIDTIVTMGDDAFKKEPTKTPNS